MAVPIYRHSFFELFPFSFPFPKKEALFLKSTLSLKVYTFPYPLSSFFEPHVESDIRRIYTSLYFERVQKKCKFLFFFLFFVLQRTEMWIWYKKVYNYTCNRLLMYHVDQKYISFLYVVVQIIFFFFNLNQVGPQ